MTRINVNIAVMNLTDEHLLAEHREIKRIPEFFRKRLEVHKFDDIPLQFTLGTGHERFFLNKGKFTFSRYEMIYQECIRRNFNVTYYGHNWDFYIHYEDFYTDYFSNEIDTALIKNRIIERLLNSKKTTWRYYGKPISKDQAIDLLNRG